MKYRMTRGDFEFMWHYRDRAGEIVIKVLKNAGYATSRCMNPNIGNFATSRVYTSNDINYIPHLNPMGLQIALNSMDPESYVYVQNVHGYTVREPRQSF
jgi:hypothetical protein